MPKLRRESPTSCVRSPGPGAAPRRRWGRGSADCIPTPCSRARSSGRVETALPIALEAGVEVEPDERLAPGATLAAVREVVEDRGETVVVVGHQPDCGLIVAELTGREARFPPGATYEVDL